MIQLSQRIFDPVALVERQFAGGQAHRELINLVYTKSELQKSHDSLPKKFEDDCQNGSCQGKSETAHTEDLISCLSSQLKKEHSNGRDQ